MRMARYLVTLYVLGLVLGLAPTATAAAVIGGAWLGPNIGDTYAVGDTVSFSATAFSDFGVDHVNFTLRTNIAAPGDWSTACTGNRALGDGPLYRCQWQVKSDTPLGDAQVGFDVYDRNGQRRNSPDDIRLIHLVGASGPTDPFTTNIGISYGSGLDVSVAPSFDPHDCYVRVPNDRAISVSASYNGVPYPGLTYARGQEVIPTSAEARNALFTWDADRSPVAQSGAMTFTASDLSRGLAGQNAFSYQVYRAQTYVDYRLTAGFADSYNIDKLTPNPFSPGNALHIGGAAGVVKLILKITDLASTYTAQEGDVWRVERWNYSTNNGNLDGMWRSMWVVVRDNRVIHQESLWNTAQSDLEKCGLYTA